MTNIVSRAKPLEFEVRGEESDNTDTLASHHIMTGLTVCPRDGTVHSVANSQASPLGTYLDW